MAPPSPSKDLQEKILMEEMEEILGGPPAKKRKAKRVTLSETKQPTKASKARASKTEIPMITEMPTMITMMAMMTIDVHYWDRAW